MRAAWEGLQGIWLKSAVVGRRRLLLMPDPSPGVCVLLHGIKVAERNKKVHWRKSRECKRIFDKTTSRINRENLNKNKQVF